jgi:lathosterol oxidase
MTETAQALLLNIGISLVVSVITFWGMGGFVHWWFYVKRRSEAARWKLQPKRFMKPEMVRHAFWLGSLNILIGSLVGGTFTWNIVEGGNTWSSLYFDPMAYGTLGLLWMPVSLVVSLLMMDAGLYYSHRFMHAKFIFRYIHRWHHRYTAPVIYTTTAMHPFEFMVFQSCLLLPALILPMHWSVYVLAIGYTYLVGMIDHSGVIVSWPLPFHSGNKFHDDHHVYFHCNYGHHTQLWDRLHGTVHQAGRRYGEHVYGGRGAAIDPGKPEPVSKGESPDIIEASQA